MMDGLLKGFHKDDGKQVSIHWKAELPDIWEGPWAMMLILSLKSEL